MPVLHSILGVTPVPVELPVELDVPVPVEFEVEFDVVILTTAINDEVSIIDK